MIEEKTGSGTYYSNEVLEQAEALQRSLQKTRVNRQALCSSIAKGVNQVILVGSGDCYFITHAAAHAFEQLSGMTVRMYEAYDFYSLEPQCGPGTLFIAFSSSGKSLYTVQAMRLARSKGAITIGLSNTAGSQLAVEATSPLLTDCGISHTFPTKTTTSALGVMFALANDLGLERKHLDAKTHARYEHEIDTLLPASLQSRLERSTDDIKASAALLFPCRHLLYIGSGAYRSSALIGAAKITETSRRLTTVCNAEEYLHMVGFGVRAEDGVVVCANETGNEREHLVAEYAAKQAAKVVVAGKSLDPAYWPSGSNLIDTCSQVPSAWADALACMVSLHLLAGEISLLGGKNPDMPDGVDVKYVIDLLYTGPVAGWKTD